MKNTLKKQESHAFRKDVYLLGQDKEGVKYWLEAPKFDCGWYWGFGYVETYTNNDNPSKAKDINSHSHIDSSFTGKINGSEYIHNIYDCPTFELTTFDKNEGWKLSELFKQFYLLKDMAAFCHKELPGCHITTSPVNHGDLKDLNKRINEVMIPAITAKIIEILKP